VNFYLSNFTNIPTLVDAVRNIAYLGNHTIMTDGLRLVRTKIFNQANGDRSHIRNVAILLTDGIPTRELDQLLAEVQRTKDSSIRIVAVGITDEVSIE